MSKELVERAGQEFNEQMDADVVNYVKARMGSIRRYQEQITDLQESIAKEQEEIEKVESGDYEDIAWTSASLNLTNGSSIRFNGNSYGTFIGGGGS